jgi:hypothetical protein
LDRKTLEKIFFVGGYLLDVISAFARVIDWEVWTGSVSAKIITT